MDLLYQKYHNQRPGMQMPLSDRQTNLQSTDATCANCLARQLTQVVAMARGAIRRVSNQIDNSPGGKAGIVVELGVDGQEAVNILAKLEALVNAHKIPGDADVSAPLAQNDLP